MTGTAVFGVPAGTDWRRGAAPKVVQNDATELSSLVHRTGTLRVHLFGAEAPHLVKQGAGAFELPVAAEARERLVAEDGGWRQAVVLHALQHCKRGFPVLSFECLCQLCPCCTKESVSGLQGSPCQ